MIEPRPTRRAVVDVGRKCNINCKFCYYHHLGDLSQQAFTPEEDIWEDCHAAVSRGNNYIDFTGGEPTIYPAMPSIISRLVNLNIKSCIITNGLAGENTTKALLAAGVDDFLVSVHGSETVHNDVTQRPDARKMQIRFMEQLRDAGMRFRVNCVIGSHNQNELANVAGWLLQYQPYIVNFINFNPHGDWSNDGEGIRSVCADLNVVEPNLNDAIGILERHGVGVNVRYYPMCRINPEYRRCVCNDLQVMFDPYEWDYDVMPKTVDVYKRHGEDISAGIEWKGYPCGFCALAKCCGGINGAYNVATFGEMVTPIQYTGETPDFWHYRQHNARTLTGGKSQC